jgi:hypothetical protein
MGLCLDRCSIVELLGNNSSTITIINNYTQFKT